MHTHWIIRPRVPTSVYIKSTGRTWRNFSYDDFILRLQTIELYKAVDPTSTVDGHTKHFNSIITEVLDEIAPTKDVILRECWRQPWIDDETREACKNARRLEKHFEAKKTQPWKQSGGQLSSQADISHSRRKLFNGSRKYTEIHSSGNNAQHIWWTADNLLAEAKSGAKPTFSLETTTPTSTECRR